MSNPLEQPWEDVTIELVYIDGTRTLRREVNLVRSEIEEQEREAYLLEAEVSENEDAIQAANAYTLSSEEFKRRIIENVEGMVNSPLRLAGDEPNQFRILPPYAVVEVRVRVNDVEPRIVRS